MLGLPQKFFPYLLRAVGVFLLNISGMLDSKDELKSHLHMFQGALDYAGYLPHAYLFVLVSVYLSKFSLLIPLYIRC